MSMLSRRAFPALVLALLLSACGRDAATPAPGPAAAAAPAEFVFTAIPDQDERQLRERFGIVAEVLSDALGVPVRYVPVKSYAAAVSAFVNDEVQLAWFGGLSGVQARLRVPGARAIAQGVEDPNYHSLLIAHHAAGVAPFEQLPEGLRGKTLSFGDKGSTSGRLMPEFFLREHFNQTPEQVFSRVGFSGDHSRTVQLVQSGAYALGFIGYTVWDSELQQGRLDPDKVQIVWRSPGYPDYQWTVRGDVDARFGAGFSDRLQQTLLAIKDPDLLARFGRSGFIPASNDDFAPVAETARAVGLIE
jgi:phosphonate transport system substrate-binding protein